ncbi:MAG: DUF58 domain-containing protein [Deltaproteobacteria bacterium]|nr:DUF58 domain-containing protein [Deltaproteobacteria bacterium]
MLPISEAQLIEFAKTVEVASTYVLEGLHHSARGGQGREFHSSLPYSVGEDIKFLDWKRYAATEKYFVNRFQKEEKAGWTILLDSSESMTYGNKAHWARFWAGSLFFLSKVWGDSCSLFPEKNFHFDETIQSLSHLGGGVNKLSEIHFDVPSQDRLIILSDFFWPNSELNRILNSASENFSSVSALQILNPEEVSFKFSGVIEFSDLESSEKLILDSRSVRSAYLKKLAELQNALDKRTSESFFHMTLAAQDEKLEKQLMKFFERL